MCYTGKSTLTAMQTRLKPGQIGQLQSGPQRRMWLRVLAMVCLLLVCVASTVQVCHVHGELSPASSDSRQTVPDHCPLCVAMHSALPATAYTDPEPVLQVQALLPTTVSFERVQRWRYELFSRPPPVVSFQA